MLEETQKMKKILVVDDNLTLLKAWTKILSKMNYAYHTTSNPEEALDELSNSHYDLLISDIVMPRMDAFDLIQKMNHRGIVVKIILTTAYVCDVSKLSLKDPVHLLMKPYNDVSEVETLVKKVLDATE